MSNTRVAFNVSVDLAELLAKDLKAGTRAELEDGTRFSIDVADAGSGSQLSNGNWANAISTLQIESVIPQTVSGELTAGGRINQIRDSGAFDLPLANSVSADVILVVELPKTFTAQTPTLTRSGSDDIRDDSGTDTVIAWVGAAKLTLTSDGISEWSL